MNNWQRLESFINFSIKGITPKYVENSSIMVLNQRCIRNNKIDYSLAQFTDDTKKINEDKIVKIGDIIFNSTGQGTAGRCAFVKELPKDKILITDSHMLLLRCNSYYEAVCLNYILYSFESTIQTFMDGSTGQGELDKIKLFNLLIKLPNNSNYQQKIANVLSSLDSKIELNNKINKELEFMAKTLYDYWFVQFDFPDVNGKPYKSSGGKMVHSKELKREIPEGWEQGTLGDISDLVRGVSYDKHDIKTVNDKDVIPILRATNITGNIIDLDDMVYVPKVNASQKQLLKKFEILMTMSSGSKEHIGKNAFFYYDKEISFGAFCAKLVPKKDFEFYLYSYTQSNFMFDTIKNECLGTNINNLNSSLVSGFQIVIPNKNQIEKFNKIVNSIYKKIANIQEQNQELAKLRDWLLPILMNGQVSVK
jgi:type I restriction enzyme S subunit